MRSQGDGVFSPVTMGSQGHGVLLAGHEVTGVFVDGHRVTVFFVNGHRVTEVVRSLKIIKVRDRECVWSSAGLGYIST